MQAAGLPFDQAVRASSLDIQQKVANAGITAKQFEQALASEQLGLEAAKTQSVLDATQQQALEILLRAILTPQKENVVLNRAGQKGFLQSALEGGFQLATAKAL